MKKILYLFVTVATVLAMTPSVGAVAEWDLTGIYVIDYVCTGGCSGTYTHTMNVTSMDLVTGDFSGVGNYHTGTPTWTVSGNVDGSSVDFRIDYDSSTYYVDVIGMIASNGSMSGTWSNPSQSGTWSTATGAATLFQRYAEITSPEADEVVYDEVDFAAYLIDNDSDYVDWAVRKGTCAAGTNTVFGNVDGHHDAFDISYNSAEYKYSYSITADVSTWASGMYCFIFNPREDAGETNIRLTREFYIADGYVSGGGQIREYLGTRKPKDDYKISFGGQVWDLGSEGYLGDWQINFHNIGTDAYDKATFHATEISVINFYPGSSNTCDEAMNMTLLGTLNGEEGYKVIFRAGDLMTGRHNNEYPNGIDTVRVELYKNGSKVYDTHGGDFTDQSSCVGSARTGLDAGNITIEYK